MRIVKLRPHDYVTRAAVYGGQAEATDGLPQDSSSPVAPVVAAYNRYSTGGERGLSGVSAGGTIRGSLASYSHDPSIAASHWMVARTRAWICSASTECNEESSDTTSSSRSQQSDTLQARIARCSAMSSDGWPFGWSSATAS